MHRRSRRQPDNLSREQLRPWVDHRPGAGLPPPAPLPDVTIFTDLSRRTTDLYDAIQNAKKLLERQAIVYTGSWTNWSIVMLDEASLMPMTPTEPGLEAEVWLKDQIQRLGEDVVFDQWELKYKKELACIKRLTRLASWAWRSATTDDQIAEARARATFARWIMTHPMMDSIAC